MDTGGRTMLEDTGGPAIGTPSRSRVIKTTVNEAKVVLLSSAKGGSAKTTTTRCLASFAAADGLRVAIIDLDEQRTLSKWWQRRSDSLPVIANYNEVPLDEAGVAVTEIAAGGHHDIIFVNTPPESNGKPDRSRPSSAARIWCSCRPRMAVKTWSPWLSGWESSGRSSGQPISCYARRIAKCRPLARPRLTSRTRAASARSTSASRRPSSGVTSPDKARLTFQVFSGNGRGWITKPSGILSGSNSG